MTWHTATVPAEALFSLLDRIRTAGGTIACSMPTAAGVRVTWTTLLAPIQTAAPGHPGYGRRKIPAQGFGSK